MLRLIKGLLKLVAGLVVAGACVLLFLYWRASASDGPEPVDAPPLAARPAPGAERAICRRRGTRAGTTTSRRAASCTRSTGCSRSRSRRRRPGSRRRAVPFLDNIERYGMLPDPKSPQNPYGLPVGVTFGRSRLSGQMMIGLNCTACHVGPGRVPGARGPHRRRAEHGVRQQVHRRHGGRDRAPRSPAHDGSRASGSASATRARRAGRSAAPARPARRPRPTKGRGRASRNWSRRTAACCTARSPRSAPSRRSRPPPRSARVDGYGRTDAFGVGRNELFGSTPPQRRAVRCAGELPPHLGHGVHGLAAVGREHQLGDGAQHRAVARRRRRLRSRRPRESSVNLENLHAMEQLTYKLRAPSWPAGFPAIDTREGGAGAAALRHLLRAVPRDLAERTARCASTQLFSLNEVGTDPNTALNYEKPVKTADGRVLAFPYAALELIKAGEGSRPTRSASFTDGARSTSGRTGRSARARAWDPTFRAPLLDHDKWDDTRGRRVYRAKTLVGIWATAPFLHNGSVPTLYDLLLPAAERPVSFAVGPARVRSGEARHRDRRLEVHASARLDAVRARHAADGQLEHRPRVEVLPLARRHPALRDHRVPEDVRQGRAPRGRRPLRAAPAPTEHGRTARRRRSGRGFARAAWRNGARLFPAPSPARNGGRRFDG